MIEHDVLVVSGQANLRYLSGFTGSSGLGLVFRDGPSYLLTDGRYRTQAAKESHFKVKVGKRPMIANLGPLLNGFRGQLGYDPVNLSVLEFEELKAVCGKGVRLKPAGGYVERLRSIKTKAEIAKIRRAARFTAEAFERAVARLRLPMTEREMAAEIQYQLAMVGAEKPAFETIVASGCRTAMPHARPTGSQIRRNAILLIDMGAQADGYTSDMTRMLVPGRATKRMERLYGYVLDAQLAAVEAVRPGATISGVDKAARNALKSQNLDRYFVHSTGHGLGLEIHETPSVSSAATGVLEEGMVITIEPGVYLEGVGGIRIEDTVVVTRTGHEILTPTPKELLVV